MDSSRAVEIKAATEGSGYLISTNLILTALHVVNSNPPPEISVYLVNEPGKQRLAKLIWPPPGDTASTGGSADIALLSLIDTAEIDIAKKFEPTIFGKMPSSGSVTVRAIGFPDGNIQNIQENGRDFLQRESWEVEGRVQAGTGLRGRAKGGTFDIVILREDQVQRSKEAWSGTSGAALFADDILIGVIVIADDERGETRLRGLPVATFFEQQSVKNAVSAAGLKLPQISATTSNPSTRKLPGNILERVLTHIDRDTISDQLTVELDDLLKISNLGTPKYLALRGRNDDDPSAFFLRLECDLQDYFPDRAQFLLKNINWPLHMRDVDNGRSLLLRSLRTALITDQNRRTSDLSPQELLDFLPKKDTALVLFFRIPTNIISEAQLTILQFWRSYLNEAAKSGARIMAVAVFEDECGVGRCCDDPEANCTASSQERRAELPPGLDPHWVMLGHLEPIKAVDVYNLVTKFRGKPEFHGVTPKITHNGAFSHPRGLRCVRIPGLISVHDHD